MSVNVSEVPKLRPAEPPLSEAAAEAWIPRICFKKGPPDRIGVEVELLVGGLGPAGLTAHIPGSRYPRLIEALGGAQLDGLDGRLTVEPGGQVELSSPAGPNVTATIACVHRDLSRLRRRARTCGVHLVGLGVDPLRDPRRINDEPRYVAMERYFRPWRSAGPAMMCSTASLQVNVEAITPTVGLADRWELLHAIGPTLVAAFANSPCRLGRPTGFKSTRQAIWHSLDPARTGVPSQRLGESPAERWTRWALDAPLMLVRRSSGDWSAPRGVTFRDWLRHGRAAVPDHPAPVLDDLAYHLTTLFPPVRARGHLEIRYVDAQPGCWWIVPAAVLAALLDDPGTADLARAACEPVRDRWWEAARSGMGHPGLNRAAVELLQLAAERFRATRVGGTSAFRDADRVADRIEGYLERWTLRGRSPADDPLDSMAAERACDEDQTLEEASA